MARIPKAELERLKAEVSVERLVEASGIALTRTGKDRVGRCPFHEEGEGSLVVTPEKNLFHCFGCGAAGGPIDWVMRKAGISFRLAVEQLRKEHGNAAPFGHFGTQPAPGRPSAEPGSGGSAPSPRGADYPKLHHLLDADEQALLNQTVDFYHETLKQAPEALAYLKARGIGHPEALQRFKLGYANRTLGYPCR